MRLPGQRSGRHLPGPLRESLDLDGDRVLAATIDLATGEHLIIGQWRLYAVSSPVDGAHQVRLRVPWHDVDGGSYDSDAHTLTVTWVGDRAAERWRIDPGQREGAEVHERFWERVQASVVLAEPVDLGARLQGRVVVRRRFSDGTLLSQVLLGPGATMSDPGQRARALAALARIEEQVGMR
ncbi:MAG: hypothetical protein IPL94_08275 [Tetrasphaera sp.]|nr:hypothetical protein [Tetrasphaera sp.]